MGAFEKFSRITPFLWFNNEAEQAVDFYLGIFPNSRKLQVLRAPVNVGVPEGSALTIAFELDGAQFTALNAGSPQKFTEAISLVVRCDSQEEIDYYWSKLSAGGEEVQCGWLKDKFGIFWQITPSRVAELVGNPAGMKAMMGMKKLDIAELERAGRTG